jgi:N-hydroxyarylamine O-acetyltransferase
MTTLSPDQADAYLRRIGLDPASVPGGGGTDRDPTLDSLTRLQRAHVTSVAFENLAIVGDPYGEWDGDGVTLTTDALFEKIVSRGRGGFCFELNGLFHSLLAALGYAPTRVASRMVDDDGSATPPANHHVNVVELDRRYVVDVGMGIPTMRRPTPLDGEAMVDEVGTEWRVAESERPDEEFCTQYRRADADEAWSVRYVFSDVPRELHYFEATCDYLQMAPESHFTGDPFATIATEVGHRKLTRGELTDSVGDDLTRRVVTGADWHRIVGEEFGLNYADVLGR